MPPKKDAKPGGAPPGPSAEDAAAKIQLIEECRAAKALSLTEQATFTALSEEKEKLNYLWALAKKDLEDKRGELRALDQARQDVGEELATEIAVHKNRVKQLLLTQQTAVTRERIDATTALKLSEETHISGERELKADKRDLAVQSKEVETGHEEFVRSLKFENDKAITELRLAFERESRELTALYDDKMARLRDDLAKAREDEIRSIEKRKTKHIQQLISAHEKAFTDIKLYFNEITHSNLDLIKSLKEEVEELKKKESTDEKVMYQIAQENKKVRTRRRVADARAVRALVSAPVVSQIVPLHKNSRLHAPSSLPPSPAQMSEPMRKALEEVRRLREEREAYRKDIQALHETKAHILVTQDQLENLKWEHEILEQRFLRLVGERDALYLKFTAALHEVKQKAGFKTLVLEHKLSAAANEVERESLTLNEVLLAVNLDPASVGSLEKKLAEVLNEKDATIAGLQQELLKLADRHDQAVAFYLRHMKEQGVRTEELGFKPALSKDLLATF